MRNKELAREIRILSTDLYLGLPFYKNTVSKNGINLTIRMLQDNMRIV